MHHNKASFQDLFDEDTNPFMKDVRFPKGGKCHKNDEAKAQMTIKTDKKECWRNIHPNEWNLFDFTNWASYDRSVAHPGNFGGRNPIREVAETGLVRLQFPAWHDMWRWSDNRSKLKFVGRYGDSVRIVDLPTELKADIGIISDLLSGDSGYENESNVICGSPDEVANDAPELRAFDEFNRVDVQKPYRFFHKRFFVQRKEVWTQVVFEAPDQLRQRLAW